MSIILEQASAIAVAAAVLAVGVYHAAVVAPRLRRASARLDVQDGLIGGDAGAAAGRLAALEAAQHDLAHAANRASARLDELERLARVDLSRCGFVRYDAYDDTGSNLSYALALLNRSGDGVVITSIYSRSDTRTYGKAVQAFAPVANASEEELAAIALARDPAPASAASA